MQIFCYETKIYLKYESFDNSQIKLIQRYKLPCNLYIQTKIRGWGCLEGEGGEPILGEF